MRRVVYNHGRQKGHDLEACDRSSMEDSGLLQSIEVHSKDIVVKYIQVGDDEKLSWQIKPIRKSIAFAIWRIPPPTAAPVPAESPPARPALNSRESSSRRTSLSAQTPGGSKDKASLALQQRLTSAGLEIVTQWKRSDAGAIEKGCLEINQGSLYALVFDNTFSVSLSKTIFFVLTSSPLSPTSLLHPAISQSSTFVDLPDIEQIKDEDSPIYYTGTLLKKRRKKLQGFAKRYFCLNTISGELSYYVRPTSVHMRGSIPLAMQLAAVNFFPKRRAFIIDSGAEVWELKAQDQLDFQAWREKIEAIRQRPSESPIAEPKTVKILEENPIRRIDLESLLLRVKLAHQSTRHLHQQLDTSALSEKIKMQSNKLQTDLSDLVTDFSAVLTIDYRDFSRRKLLRPASIVSSLVSNDAWYDASPGDEIDHEYMDEEEDDHYEDEDDVRAISSSSGSDDDDEDEKTSRVYSPIKSPTASNKIYIPSIAQRRVLAYLYPLDTLRGRRIRRRENIPTPIIIPPPSLLTFIRKNVCYLFYTSHKFND